MKIEHLLTNDHNEDAGKIESDDLSDNNKNISLTPYED